MIDVIVSCEDILLVRCLISDSCDKILLKLIKCNGGNTYENRA